MGGILGGKVPADRPLRIGERGLDGVQPKQQNASDSAGGRAFLGPSSLRKRCCGLARGTDNKDAFGGRLRQASTWRNCWHETFRQAS